MSKPTDWYRKLTNNGQMIVHNGLPDWCLFIQQEYANNQTASDDFKANYAIGVACERLANIPYTDMVIAFINSLSQKEYDFRTLSPQESGNTDFVYECYSPYSGDNTFATQWEAFVYALNEVARQ